MKCTICKKYTPKHSFATFRQRDGSVGRRGCCRACREKQSKQSLEEKREYRRNYNVANRTEKAVKARERRDAVKAVLDKIKSEAACADCGGKFPPVAMDFDHVHGKNKSIASMYSQAYKIDLILEEIKLCEIVCACCHRIRTRNRKQNHSDPRAKNRVVLVDPS